LRSHFCCCSVENLDCATGKMRTQVKFLTFSTAQQEKWEFTLRNRKNENASQILDILDSATGKMRMLLREYWVFRLRFIKLIFFSAEIFCQFLVIKAWIRIRDPESGSAIRKNAGYGSISWSMRIRIPDFYCCYVEKVENLDCATGKMRT
jgi:hypothetical protein